MLTGRTATSDDRENTDFGHLALFQRGLGSPQPDPPLPVSERPAAAARSHPTRAVAVPAQLGAPVKVSVNGPLGGQ